MIKKYLEKVSRFLSKPSVNHPHYTRSYRLPDGTIVTSDSYDDVDSDDYYERECPSVSEQLAAGEKPNTMRFASTCVLTDAQFADMFVREFNRRGMEVAPPLPSAEPSVEPSVVEPKE